MNITSWIKQNRSTIQLYLVSLIFFIYHYSLNKEIIFSPLFADEWYYAVPIELSKLHLWPNFSFGHPPLYHLFTSFYYSIISSTPNILHFISFILSYLLVFLILRIFHKRNSLLSGIILVMLLYGDNYFVLNSSAAHPIILGSIFLLLMLFSENKKRTTLLSCFAFFTRESLLVSVPMLFIKQGLKRSYFFIYQLVACVSVYSYYYYMKNDIMMNDQVKYRLHLKQEVMTFKLRHFLEFYTNLFFNYNNLLIGFLLLFALYFSKRNKLIASCLIGAFLHSMFFAFYTEHSSRDAYYSSFLIFTAIAVMSSEYINYKKIAYKILLCAFLIFSSYRNYDLYIEMKQNSSYKKFIQNTSVKVLKTIKKYELKYLLTDFVISSAFKSKYMGYHDLPDLNAYFIRNFHHERKYFKTPDIIVDTSHHWVEKAKELFPLYINTDYKFLYSYGENDFKVDVYILKSKLNKTIDSKKK